MTGTSVSPADRQETFDQPRFNRMKLPKPLRSNGFGNMKWTGTA